MIRDIIHHLSPAPAGSLEQLRAAALEVEEEFSTAVHLALDDATATALECAGRPAVECLLKVAREAAINAVKHAAAPEIIIEVTVGEGGTLRLSVNDDGVGLPDVGYSPETSYGLPSMRRAVSDARGLLTISTGRNDKGTLVTAIVPR